MEQLVRRTLVLTLLSIGLGGSSQSNALTPEQVINLTPAKKREQCIRAFGHERFCDCVVSNIPASIFFLEYVALSMGTDNEIEYSKMSEEQKRGVDRVRAAREKCVNTALR
jgi:hypothetical protein